MKEVCIFECVEYDQSYREPLGMGACNYTTCVAMESSNKPSSTGIMKDEHTFKFRLLTMFD